VLEVSLSRAVHRRLLFSFFSPASLSRAVTRVSHTRVIPIDWQAQPHQTADKTPTNTHEIERAQIQNSGASHRVVRAPLANGCHSSSPRISILKYAFGGDAMRSSRLSPGFVLSALTSAHGKQTCVHWVRHRCCCQVCSTAHHSNTDVLRLCM
jgi:hypothetical protein